MNSWEIILAPEAAKDIRNLYDYISDTLLVPTTAKNVVRRILETIHSLENMPMRYPLYEKDPWRSRGLRKVRAGNFVVFFLPNETTHEVVIFHVLYGRRDIERMLQDND